MKTTQYDYYIVPHPHGLGVIINEYRNKKPTTWRSNNYAVTELAETAMRNRVAHIRNTLPEAKHFIFNYQEKWREPICL